MTTTNFQLVGGGNRTAAGSKAKPRGGKFLPGRGNHRPGETPSGAPGSGTGVTVDLASQPVKSKTVLNSLVGTFGNTMVMGPGQLALNGTAGVSSICGARNEGVAT